MVLLYITDGQTHLAPGSKSTYAKIKFPGPYLERPSNLRVQKHMTTAPSHEILPSPESRFMRVAVFRFKALGVLHSLESDANLTNLGKL